MRQNKQLYLYGNQNYMRLSFFSLTFFSFLVVLSSCQKEGTFDPNSPNTPAGASGNFTAKINGASWSANKVAAATRFSGFISLGGLSTDHKMITITLTDSGVHKYTLSDVTLNAGAFVDSSENVIAYTSNGGDYPTRAGGEVTITAIDTTAKTISGTFSFKAFRQVDNQTKTITEGSFTDLPYATTMPATQTSDTLRLKLDGTSWTPYSVLGVNMGGQIAVTGSNELGTKSFGLVFPSNIKPGAYELDFFGATYTGQYNPDADPNNSKASFDGGTLTILEHNTTTKRIRGNFAFKASELLKPQNFVMVSDGYFSVKY